MLDRYGNTHRFEAVATNLLDEPTMRGVILNSRDITDRANLERELREREEQLPGALRIQPASHGGVRQRDATGSCA